MATIQPPNTKTSTSHAMTIIAANQMIGAISSWAVNQTLPVVGVYEFGQVTGPFGIEAGMPYEKIPGNVGGMTIEVARYDLYTKRIEEVFGTIDLTVLSNDPNAFDVREAWRTPDNTNNYVIIYQGCRFSKIGRTIATTDDRIVKASATIEYTRPLKQTV